MVLVWKVTVGLNLWRPILVAFYAAVYLVPFTFPAMFRLKAFPRRMALTIAIVAGVVLAFFSSSLLQPGPLNSFIRTAARLPHGGTLLFAFIAIVVPFNSTSVCILLWQKRQSVFSCPPAAFALLSIVFFVAEQIGVGGNLPFYDRYVLQIAPFWVSSLSSSCRASVPLVFSLSLVYPFSASSCSGDLLSAAEYPGALLYCVRFLKLEGGSTR
jgi:hypothetical protein